MSKMLDTKLVLTEDTPIPTDRRPYVRAFVKSRPEFEGWTMGLCASRDIKNLHLKQFAIECGWAWHVAVILTMPHAKLREMAKALKLDLGEK